MSKKKSLFQLVYELSKKVSVDLTDYADGYEDELSLLLSQQLKKRKINFLREVTNYHYSKNSDSIGLKTDRPDFVLMPDKEYDVKSPIIVECKFGSIDKLIQGRTELLRYLKSHKNSSYKDLQNTTEGLVILWSSTNIYNNGKTSTKPKEPKKDETQEMFLKRVHEYESDILRISEYSLEQPRFKVVVEYWKLDKEKMLKIDQFGYRFKKK